MKRATLPPTPASITDRFVSLKHQMWPAPDVAPLALQAFLVGDQLAGVVDDPCVLGDARGREDAPPMDTRTPFLNHS